MLVLGRKVNQSVDLFDRKSGEHIARIVITDDRGVMGIGLGIEAGRSVVVLRSELITPSFDPYASQTTGR
jgi:sRNA-binding carbon storage regulator CsrA